jgi:hypothetical protein
MKAIILSIAIVAGSIFAVSAPASADYVCVTLASGNVVCR